VREGTGGARLEVVVVRLFSGCAEKDGGTVDEDAAMP
jgi:hypothetical protein